jgi:hypothetical protein
MPGVERELPTESPALRAARMGMSPPIDIVVGNVMGWSRRGLALVLIN